MTAKTGNSSSDNQNFSATHTPAEPPTNLTNPEQFAYIIKKGKKEWEKTVDAIEDIITILDTDLRIIRANRTAHQEFGENRGTLIGMKCHEAFHNSEEPCKNCPVLKTLENAEIQRSLMYLEYSGKTFDITGSPLFDEKGRLSMIVHVARDVTHSIRQEEERNRLATAIKHVSESIVVTDVKGNIQYTNPAFTEITGYTSNEAIGKNIDMLRSGEHDDEFYATLWKHIKEGNVWRGKFINRKKDKSLYPEESTISPIFDAEGNITSFVAIKRDVSNEEALQKKLQQAIKLEAIGTLAGGIAHDFNNILSSIIGYAEIAQDYTKDNLPAQNALDQIILAGDKAADLVKQIMLFSRQDYSSGHFKPLKIQYILKEALKLIRSSLPATIKISQNVDKNCSAIMADAAEIHQAIMNLFTNASQAIGKNYGEISVELSDEDKGKHIRLVITDNGCGMSEKELKRIFDPFFSTKPKRYGTGLGLSIVHGIVNNHNGTIDVQSSVGQGTTFTIQFPAIPKKHTKKNDDKKFISGGEERILIIDDERSLIDFFSLALTRLGYKITSFCDSIEAVRHFRENSNSFDLVLTDMTMPNMTGAELAREILSLRPDIPIILTTGFNESIDAEKARRIGIKKFIAKPFKKDVLARMIREILDNG